MWSKEETPWCPIYCLHADCKKTECEFNQARMNIHIQPTVVLLDAFRECARYRHWERANAWRKRKGR